MPDPAPSLRPGEELLPRRDPDLVPFNLSAEQRAVFYATLATLDLTLEEAADTPWVWSVWETLAWLNLTEDETRRFPSRSRARSQREAASTLGRSVETLKSRMARLHSG